MRFQPGMRREPLGGSARDWDAPQVAFAGEDDRVAMNRRETVVAGWSLGKATEAEAKEENRYQELHAPDFEQARGLERALSDARTQKIHLARSWSGP